MRRGLLKDYENYKGNLKEGEFAVTTDENLDSKKLFVNLGKDASGKNVTKEVAFVGGEVANPYETKTIPTTSTFDSISSKALLNRVEGNTEKIDDKLHSVGDNWACVDLGDLDWTYDVLSAGSRFTSSENIHGLPLGPVRTVDVYCPIYTTINDGRPSAEITDMSIFNSANLEKIFIIDNRFNNPNDFKKAMKGTYAYFKPASEPSTPTYYCIQIKCNDDISFIPLTQPLCKLNDLVDRLVLRSDGTGYIERKLGVVDLGSLSWTYTNGYFYSSTITDMVATRYGENLICALYTAKSTSADALADKKMMCANTRLYLKDSAYTDATAFKTAMNGIPLVYELAQPTITELSAEQLREIYKLKTFDGSTTIEALTDCECDFEIKVATSESGAYMLTSFAQSMENKAKIDLM